VEDSRPRLSAAMVGRVSIDAIRDLADDDFNAEMDKIGVPRACR
jgi:hypothetical protein